MAIGPTGTIGPTETTGPTGTIGPTETTGPIETMGPTGGAPTAPLFMIQPTAKVRLGRSNGKGHHYHGVPKHGQNANRL